VSGSGGGEGYGQGEEISGGTGGDDWSTMVEK